MDPGVVKDRAQDALEDAAESTWLGRMARAGLAARGLIYVVVAILALKVATGHNETEADKKGAMQAVVRQPFGRLLVLLVAVGFGGYALWRFVEAAVGRPGEQDDHEARLKRLGYAARGVLYASLAASAVELFLWAGKAATSQHTESDWTARVLQWPGGTWLVQAVGLGLIGGGLYVGWRGLAGKFRKSLKSVEQGQVERRWIRAAGTVGMVARMLVFVMIGVFLITAARQHDPGQAVGIDGALKRLAGHAYGPALLVLVAFGLGVYGLYSLAEARYRRVGGS